MFWISARREYEKLRALYTEMPELLDEPQLFEAVTRVSRWTPAQHLHHLVGVNASVFGWLDRCCHGEPPEVAGRERLNVAGWLVLLLGRIPRGRAASPKRYRPPAAVGRAELGRLLEQSQHTLDRLEPCVPRLRALEARLRHPMLGMLDANEWMRFLRIHTRHHLVIAHDILEQHGDER